MRVTNWRRNLMVGMMAGGIFAPAAAMSADLNTNLVTDPSFENVDPNDIGPSASLRLLNWSDTNADGNAADDDFSYRFAQNYAGVNTPAGAGEHYFSGGFSTTNGQATIAQAVDVSTGATGSLIASGEAAFELSGFFSSYLTQLDASSLRVRFLNASATELGRANAGGLAFVQTLSTSPSIKVFDPPPPVPPAQRNWGRDVHAGLIPIGTTSVVVEVVSDIAAENHDGFVDLVDFRVRNAPEMRMYLEVNTTTGHISIRNEVNAAISIDYYEITSASNALNVSEWNSLQEQDLAGFPPGNGSGNGWERFGGSDAGVIGESYLTGNSSLANSESVGLGTAFNVGGVRDLVFQYGALTTTARVTGDYNNDGTVNAADYVIWRDKLNQDATLPNDSTPGTVTQADYDVWRTNFGRTGAPTGPSTLITGFVRYVNGELINGAAVPEQASVCLVGIGLGPLLIVTRRRSSEF